MCQSPHKPGVLRVHGGDPVHGGVTGIPRQRKGSVEARWTTRQGTYSMP